MSRFKSKISDEKFKQLWDSNLSSEEVGKQAGPISSRGANLRAQRLGLPPKRIRMNPFRRQRISILDLSNKAVSALNKGTGSPHSAESNPLADPKIKELTERIEELSMSSTSAKDLSKLQWTLLQLLLTIFTRSPMKSWHHMAECTGMLFELVIRTRKVESEMPTPPNPVILRQEAARQLMSELASVLDPEEQRIMGELIDVAADRIAANHLTVGNGRPPIPTVAPVNYFGVGRDVPVVPPESRPW